MMMLRRLLASRAVGGICGAQRPMAFHASAMLRKSREFLLADIGEGIAEVEILQWYVKPGDKIQQFDKICEVQSDKATVEITSRFDGVIMTLNVEKGKMAIVGKSLVTIDAENGDDEPEQAQAAASTAPAASDVALAPIVLTDQVLSDKVRTTPAVRRMSREHNIDLTAVTPTGPGGRILKEDLFKFLEGGTATAIPSITTPSAAPLDNDMVKPITGLARIMVKTMTAANAIPTMTLHEEICIDQLHEIRTGLKNAVPGLPSLSYFPFILKAVSIALTEFPSLNAHVNPECTELTLKSAHNIAIAMDTDKGLIVPNVKNVNLLSIGGIGLEIHRLSQLGVAGKLGTSDLQGGTISLSNIGSIGGTYATPLIVTPQVVIGAIGRIQRGIPRYGANGQLGSHSIMSVSWSGDHRVLDGATMARFSNRVKSILENPHHFLLALK